MFLDGIVVSFVAAFFYFLSFVFSVFPLFVGYFMHVISSFLSTSFFDFFSYTLSDLLHTLLHFIGYFSFLFVFCFVIALRGHISLGVVQLA